MYQKHHKKGFKFYDGYPVPECKTIEEYNEFINNLPLQDIPEVFGLHANADISYQINTAKGNWKWQIFF